MITSGLLAEARSLVAFSQSSTLGDRPAWKTARHPTRSRRLLQKIERQFEIGGARSRSGKRRQRLGDQVLHIARRVGDHVQLDDARRGFALVPHLVKPAAALRAVDDIERR